MLNSKPLNKNRDVRLVLCAEQLFALSTSSANAFALSLHNLEQSQTVTREEWVVAFSWAHSLVRHQAEEILETAGVISAKSNGYSVDATRARIVRVALRAIDRHDTPPSSPAIWVTPADLLPAIDANVGELRRLIISILAGCKKRVTVLTPFFSLRALREVLVPVQSSALTISLYVSIESDRIHEADRLVEVVKDVAPLSSVSLFVHTRASTEWNSIPHAKLILCDGEIGYLGSANISRQGLHSQFEVGVRLNREAVHNLEQIVDELVRRGLFERFWDSIPTNPSRDSQRSKGGEK